MRFLFDFRTSRGPLQLAGALLGMGLTMIAAAAPPIQLHPENPRYFIWRDQPTVLITSGEHYGAVLNADFDYSFTAGHPRGTLRDYRSPGGGSPELRAQLKILKQFVESFDFIHMRPAQETVLNVKPEHAVRLLAQEGSAYALYCHVRVPKKPEKIEEVLQPPHTAQIELRLPAGSYYGSWIDPVQGGTLAVVELDRHAGGPLQLSTPEFTTDVALRLMRRQAEAR